MSSSLVTGPLLRARSDDFSCLSFLNRCRRCLSYFKTTHKMSWPHLPTEFTRTSNVEVCSVKEKPQTTRNDVTNLYHTLKCYLNIRHDHRQSKTPWKSRHENDVSALWETDKFDWCWYLETSENPSTSRGSNRQTRKNYRPARVDDNRSRWT